MPGGFSAISFTLGSRLTRHAVCRRGPSTAARSRSLRPSAALHPLLTCEAPARGGKRPESRRIDGVTAILTHTVHATVDSLQRSFDVRGAASRRLLQGSIERDLGHVARHISGVSGDSSFGLLCARKGLFVGRERGCLPQEPVPLLLKDRAKRGEIERAPAPRLGGRCPCRRCGLLVHHDPLSYTVLPELRGASGSNRVAEDRANALGRGPSRVG